jgi:azurin
VPNVPIAQQFLLANSPVAGPDEVTGGVRAGGIGASASARRVAAPWPITLGVISGQMKFTQTTIAARPGQRVEITLNNTDDMPHNIVIFRRGTLAEYEKELFGSLNETERAAARVRPGFAERARGLAAAERGESDVVTFDAPAEPGEYPFVCSFPGHWATMRGVLRIE